MLTKNLLAIASAVAFGLGFTGSAAAVVLDFDSLETPTGGSVLASSPYTEDGFQIHGTALVYFSQDSMYYPGSAGLFVGTSGGTAVLMESLNGNPFTLSSIDLSVSIPNATSPPIEFIGELYGGGTVSQTFTPTEFGFTQFNFNSSFKNLTSVSWVQGIDPLNGHQFDNIVVTANVPEPASILSILVLSAFAINRVKRHK